MHEIHESQRALRATWGEVSAIHHVALQHVDACISPNTFHIRRILEPGAGAYLWCTKCKKVVNSPHQMPPILAETEEVTSLRGQW